MTSESDPIQEAVKQLEALEATIRKVKGLLRRAEASPTEVEAAITRAPDVIEQLDSEASRATDSGAWRRVRDDVSLRAATHRLQLGSRLQTALQSEFEQVTGAFPAFVVDGVTVVVDPIKGATRVGRTRITSTEPSRLIAAVRRVRRPPVTPSGEADVTRVHAAYIEAAAAVGTEPGQPVAIRSVYAVLRSTRGRHYSLSAFGKDLAALLGNADPQLELLPPRNRREGVVIPYGEGIPVGSIRWTQRER